MDPYQRAPRSPRGKKPQQPQPLNGSNPALNEEGARSPTSDQVSTKIGWMYQEVRTVSAVKFDTF